MEAQDATHVCPDCGKGFHSGRALGGHWRTHVSERRRAAAESDVVSPENPELPQKNPELSESDVASSSRSLEKPEFSVPCRVCKKSFPTEKALAGHMRCHPERQWSGVNPPAESPTSSGGVRDFPASWGRKGRRNQTSSDMAIAAEALLELSDQRFQGKIIRVSEKNQGSSESKPKQIDMKAITEVSTESMYKCSECERSFTTFQALGGHRSTHNKDLQKNKKLKIKKSDSTGKIHWPILKIKSEEEPQLLLESCSKSTDKTVDSAPESRSGIPEGPQVPAPRLRFDFDLNEPACDDMALTIRDP